MIRGTLACVVLGIAAGACVEAGVAACAAESAPRPNIVVIVCDDMGFSDLGCYGGEINTPNIDQLAKRGIRFTDFHNNAKCTETRASLLTGLWHQQSRQLKQPGQVTLAEVLKSAGYRTMMSGKWHLAGTPPERGFDRYFGFLSGAVNYFTGADWASGENLMRLDRQEFKPGKDFYTTDAFTDYAIEFVDEARGFDQPFFLYLAYNAPHFPLQAPPEDIARYKGKYDEGWDVIRARRFANLKKLGVADESWRLSDRDPKVEPWSTVTDKQRDFLVPMMEVYAAMVDRLDQNVGRLVQHLRKNELLDDTLILFFSDNGACPYDRLRTPGVAPGPANSDYAYDARWANMCNAPLRLYKQYAHEGGSATPMIAHWPTGIAAPGSLSPLTSHLVDLMPTFVELAGADYPASRQGRKVLPMEGISLTAALRREGEIGVPAGDVTKRGNHPLFWEFNGNRAIRDGQWKLVAQRSKDWELYDLSTDRSETNDLAEKNLDVVTALAAKYNAWAARVGAKSHEQAKAQKPSGQSQLFELP